MDSTHAGADASNELDVLGWNHLSARKAFLARGTSAVYDFNGTRRRGYNAVTESGPRNDRGFEQVVRGTMSQLGSMRNITTSVEIQFLPENGYPPSLHRGARNAGSVRDVN